MDHVQVGAARPIHSGWYKTLTDESVLIALPFVGSMALSVHYGYYKTAAAVIVVPAAYVALLGYALGGAFG